MIERIRFGRTDLFKVLEDVSMSLNREVDAYLIGGLSMMHRGPSIYRKVMLSRNTL